MSFTVTVLLPLLFLFGLLESELAASQTPTSTTNGIWPTVITNPSTGRQWEVRLANDLLTRHGYSIGAVHSGRLEVRPHVPGNHTNDYPWGTVAAKVGRGEAAAICKALGYDPMLYDKWSSSNLENNEGREDDWPFMMKGYQPALLHQRALGPIYWGNLSCWLTTQINVTTMKMWLNQWSFEQNCSFAELAQLQQNKTQFDAANDATSWIRSYTHLDDVGVSCRLPDRNRNGTNLTWPLLFNGMAHVDKFADTGRVVALFNDLLQRDAPQGLSPPKSVIRVQLSEPDAEHGDAEWETVMLYALGRHFPEKDEGVLGTTAVSGLIVFQSAASLAQRTQIYNLYTTGKTNRTFWWDMLRRGAIDALVRPAPSTVAANPSLWSYRLNEEPLAGVVKHTEQFLLSLWKKNNNTYTNNASDAGAAQRQDHGQVIGKKSRVGRIELQPGPQAEWGSLCSVASGSLSGFVGVEEAAALCNTVHRASHQYLPNTVLPLLYYGGGYGPIYLSNLQCTNTSPPLTFLDSCPTFDFNALDSRGSNFCHHGMDLGLNCDAAAFYLSKVTIFAALIRRSSEGDGGDGAAEKEAQLFAAQLHHLLQIPRHRVNILSENVLLSDSSSGDSGAGGGTTVSRTNVIELVFAFDEPKEDDLSRVSASALEHFFMSMGPEGLLDLFHIEQLLPVPAAAVGDDHQRQRPPPTAYLQQEPTASFVAEVDPTVQTGSFIAELASAVDCVPYLLYPQQRDTVLVPAVVDRIVIEVAGGPTPLSLRESAVSRLEALAQSVEKKKVDANTSSALPIGLISLKKVTSGSGDGSNTNKSSWASSTLLMTSCVFLVIIAVLVYALLRSRSNLRGRGRGTAKYNRAPLMMEEGTARAVVRSVDDTPNEEQPPEREEDEHDQQLTREDQCAAGTVERTAAVGRQLQPQQRSAASLLLHSQPAEL